MTSLVFHALFNAIIRSKSLFRYWQRSPIGLLNWIVYVAMGMLYSLDWTVYIGTLLSLFLVVLRHFTTRDRFLGIVRRDSTWKGAPHRVKGPAMMLALSQI